MTFRDDVVTVTLADATVTGLIGSNLYPDRRPVDCGDPCAVYHAYVSDTNVVYRAHDGAGRTQTRVSFDCWASSSRSAEAVATALEGVWNGRQYPDQDIGWAFKENRISDGYHSELNKYRVIIDFSIEHGE